jgi:hypothetical protein
MPIPIPRVKKDEYDLSDDFVDDSFLRQIDAVTASQGGRVEAKRGYKEIDEDEEDEFGEFDENGWKEVEQIEKARRSRVRTNVWDDDDDGVDKENTRSRRDGRVIEYVGSD